jgi:hypothetical protein
MDTSKVKADWNRLVNKHNIDTVEATEMVARKYNLGYSSVYGIVCEPEAFTTKKLDQYIEQSKILFATNECKNEDLEVHLSRDAFQDVLADFASRHFPISPLSVFIYKGVKIKCQN